jgi:two-component system, chemotaxis family, CheB/CheR fusion protein
VAEDAVTESVEARDRLEQLLEYVKSSRGFDFTGYKRSSLERRIRKRMHLAGIDDFVEYLDYLQVHPGEFEQLFNTILINVTSFFRDRFAWDYLAANVVPEIVENGAPSRPIRIWCAGCSTGEEAYSVVMLLADQMGEREVRKRVKIYATDVDNEALAYARHASYTEKEMEPLPPEVKQRYFEAVDGHYSFSPDLRRCVIFGRHDLVQDAPISRVDLLVCRNTLMYFNAQTQTQILGNFAFALRDGGYLFLGKSEVLLSRSASFTPVDMKRRVFSRLPRDADLPARGTPTPASGAPGLSRDPLLSSGFEMAPTAQILIDRDGRLALANHAARGLFGLTVADVGRQLQDLEVSYRPVELRSRIEQAAAERRLVTLHDVDLQSPGGARLVDVHVLPLINPNGEPAGTSIAFADVTRYRTLQNELLGSKRELETAYEELQSTVEELETTNEELQSTNEELETTNEELQSTNEELETMNEELQSTNEELETINEELRVRTNELNRVNGFLESILSSLDSGVVVVDRDLRVQVWNTKATDLWGLRDDEVAGEHLLNLDIGLPVDQLRAPLRAVLSQDGDGATQDLVLHARNRRGRDIDCRVSVTSLGASDGVVGGAILLMEPQAGE